jgi:hypothetical protein
MVRSQHSFVNSGLFMAVLIGLYQPRNKKSTDVLNYSSQKTGLPGAIRTGDDASSW